MCRVCILFLVKVRMGRLSRTATHDASTVRPCQSRTCVLERTVSANVSRVRNASSAELEVAPMYEVESNHDETDHVLRHGECDTLECTGT